MNSDPVSAERRLRRNAWAFVVVASASALALGAPFAAAVAGGGILSALNLEGLLKTVQFVTARTPKKGATLAAVGLGLRYLLLGVALFVIVSVWHANVLGLVLGLSAPVAAVFLEWGLDSIREFRANSDKRPQ